MPASVLPPSRPFYFIAATASRMDVDGLSGSVERLNLGDAPEAGALAAAVASAAVGATSSPASASGFSKAVDDSSANNQGGSQTPGAGPAAHDKDNDVEGKLFIGGISWQTTEEGLRCGIVASRSPFLSLASDFVSAVCLARYGCRGFALPLSLGVVGFEESSCLVAGVFFIVFVFVSSSFFPPPDLFLNCIFLSRSWKNHPSSTATHTMLSVAPPYARRHHFGKYGTLADIALMKDKYTGHPRGFGFIKFEDLTGTDRKRQRHGTK